MAGFIELYDQCFSDVYRFVYSRVGNQWDTDDLVSEIFTKAHRKWSTVRGDARAWLFTIARHTVTDFYRRHGREIPEEKISERMAGESVDPYRSSPALDCLRSALEQLPDEQQELIGLRYFADLQYKEIANTLGVTEACIKMRVRRVLGLVKEMVKKCLVE